MKFRIILLILIVTVSVKQAHRYHDSDEHNDKDDLMTTDHSTYRLELEAYDDESNIRDAQYVIKEITSIILADLDIQFKEILKEADVDESLATFCNIVKTIAVCKMQTEICKELQVTVSYVAKRGLGHSDESFTRNNLNKIKDIKTLIENCFADNKTEPMDCVYKQIIADTSLLLAHFQYLGEKFLKSADHATAWITKIQDNFNSKKNDIITDYKKCVNQLKNNNIVL